MATVLSIDGVGAQDHVLGSAMLTKVHNVFGLRVLLPFVQANLRSAGWSMSGVRQVEGGEHGDPFMPLLFSLAIHDSLVEANFEMDRSEHFLGEKLEMGGKTQSGMEKQFAHPTSRTSVVRFGTQKG